MSEQLLQQILNEIKEIKSNQVQINFDLKELKNDVSEIKYKQKHLSCDMEFINNIFKEKMTKPYQYYGNYLDERDKKIEVLNQRVLKLEAMLEK